MINSIGLAYMYQIRRYGAGPKITV